LRAAIIRAESLLREREDLIREYQHLNKLLAWQREAAQRVAHLTPRQHEIMDLVLVGTPSKNIAADLHISQRTVENHRAAIMRKTGSKCLPALARLGFAAALEDDRESVVRGE
jgi:two-component system CheB/CheR fusion protein